MSDAQGASTTDLLHGVNAIAEHLNLTAKQVYHLHGNGGLPTFKMGKTVCARRSTLAKHFAAQEAAAARSSAGEAK
jgi:hypothetical protein